MANTKQLHKQPSSPSVDIVSLFKEFPHSNMQLQWQLVGAGDAMSNDNSPAYQTTSIELDGKLISQIDVIIASASFDRAQFFISAYHLLIQNYLNDEESVLAIRAVEDVTSGSPEVNVSASYYYYDEDSTTIELVTEIADFHEDFGMRKVSSGQYSDSTARLLPLFYYDLEDAVSHADVFSPISLSVNTLASTTTASLRLMSRLTLGFNAAGFLENYVKMLSALSNGSSRLPPGTIGGTSTAMPQASIIRAEIQLKMKPLWQTILEVDINDIRPDSCYFALGGTSLNAFLLVNKIRLEFEVDINIRNIVENSTLSELSEFIASMSG